MTDAEINSLEEQAWASADGTCGREAILLLVAELRQTRAEMDWIADYIATLTGKKSYNTKEHWIKAAKEAVCQKN